MGTLICAVCNAQASKYRCPKCRVRYCSVQCFQDHKNTDQTCKADLLQTAPAEGKTAEPPTPSSRTGPQTQSRFSSSESAKPSSDGVDDEEEANWKISEEEKRKVRAS